MSQSSSLLDVPSEPLFFPHHRSIVPFAVRHIAHLVRYQEVLDGKYTVKYRNTDKPRYSLTLSLVLYSHRKGDITSGYPPCLLQSIHIVIIHVVIRCTNTKEIECYILYVAVTQNTPILYYMASSRCIVAHKTAIFLISIFRASLRPSISRAKIDCVVCIATRASSTLAISHSTRQSAIDTAQRIIMLAPPSTTCTTHSQN